MNSRILIVTGPAGAGKSTLSENWAFTRENPCAHLSLDSFRQFVKSGYADPSDGWSDETRRQLDIARSNIAAATKNYLKSDLRVVIDDAVFPEWEEVNLDQWANLLPEITIDLVVLMPDWEVVRSRNAERTDQDHVPEKILRTIYDDMSGWRDKPEVTVVDNSALSVSETIAQIEQALG